MDLENLSIKIKKDLNEIGKPFSDFHKKVGPMCPPSCGKCCINPEISCHPYELLPLAFNLLKKGEAENILEKAKSNFGQVCILLNIENEEKGVASCLEYDNRPSICRAFGISGRHDKKMQVELSICKILKSMQTEFNINELEVPFIDLIQIKLEACDPVFLGPHLPINEALVIALEKVLMFDYYRNLSSSDSSQSTLHLE